MLSDQYIDKEENTKIKDVLFDLLTRSETVQLNSIDAGNPEVRASGVADTMCRVEKSGQVQTCPRI